MSIEVCQFSRFEDRVEKMDRFHKKIIQSRLDFDQSCPLLFLELDGLRLCHTELIPKRITDRGYNPNVDPQTIVLGKEPELADWRERHGLATEEFVIEPSAFGYHIDVYGEDVAKLIGQEKNKLTEREYTKLI